MRQGRSARGQFPDVFKDLSDFTQIGDEGDDPHLLPALSAGQRVGFLDFPDPFRPA